ncbi:MAG: adenosylmethionine decarboxylase [Gammaproteobacteria bacterium]|nr:MAG: adenosylmethionine decarboxylase [Gammaproteobacteria bacterium]
MTLISSNLNSTNKLQLHGFNNLTKSFACSAYIINYVDAVFLSQYQQYIEKNFSAEQLSQLLLKLCDTIGATVLNIAKQDYQPQGSSATLLIADSKNFSAPETLVGHLDKSHICVHTYPEYHPNNGMMTIRLDFEISTCGVISPLNALNQLLLFCNADIVTLDYRVRGFTRNKLGEKLFQDHAIVSIQDFINTNYHQYYEMMDANMAENNLFNTKLMRKEFCLENYLFLQSIKDIKHNQALVCTILNKERKEIFYGRNI